MPLKRVEVDIGGQIAPPSEAGHRYILILVDYATRYLQALPLNKITTEAVSEVLNNIYSEVGVPEEVLTDQGIYQGFMSKCTQEVSRLLNMKVEIRNGTLKSMLEKLCQDQLK